MGVIGDYFNRLRERKRERESFEGEQHMVQNFQQKKLSSNERELLRYQEEERQKRIKLALEQKRKRENDKVWRGQEGNPTNAKNVVGNHKKIFSGKNMFANTPNVSRQPNVIRSKNVIGGEKR